jgi:hypothetical protein
MEHVQESCKVIRDEFPLQAIVFLRELGALRGLSTQTAKA